MSTDSNELTDAVSVELNGGDQLPSLERPADGAKKASWVDYVVALGADRGFVEDQEHTVAELRDLADRLGG